MVLNRRKPFKYTNTRTPRVSKTSRAEIPPETRAFIAGAVLFGNAKQHTLAHALHRPQGTISKLLSRIKERAEAGGFDLWDPILYTNDFGRGRPEVLSCEQKDEIIRITTQDRNHREQESWQAIKHRDFEAIAPNLSVSTFENVMYEAGYKRRKPGWKPPLSSTQRRERLQWALSHNPDRYEVGDGLGFDFRTVVFTDETPARVGEERGMIRTWAHDDEIYDDDVRHTRNRKDCCLQFFGSFRYNYKGPCHVYFHETEEEKEVAERLLELENAATRTSSNRLQQHARAALQELGEMDINLRNSTKKLQHVKKHDYHRGIRSRGGVDGYRHREGALKKVAPWINMLQHQGIKCVLLEDGAPPHKSRIANDYLRVHQVEKMGWPGHSPDVNASEHAWPWLRSHVTKQFTPSCNPEECKKQWETEWAALPQELINRWVMGVPKIVRRIIANEGKNNFHG
jgi:transposase